MQFHQKNSETFKYYIILNALDIRSPILHTESTLSSIKLSALRLKVLKKLPSAESKANIRRIKMR